MNNFSAVSIIIPSLNPTDELVRVVTGLIGAGFDDIIIVNDGSDAEHIAPFEKVQDIPGCTVLTHKENMGKGAALKTAFGFYERERPGRKGIVTVDGDGQHLTSDIVKCALSMLQSVEAVVIGVRDFQRPDVPKRNSIGNRATAFAFRILFGIGLRDTQTGLRAIPSQHIPLLIGIQGSRFQYETAMLLELKHQDIPIQEVEIETVYMEGSNDRSNYRPLVDSVMIFSRILRYALGSISSFLVDIGVFWLALWSLGRYLEPWDIPICTAIARAVSSFVNFNINRRFVFRRKETYGRHLWRYYTLAVFQMLAAAGALWLLAQLFSGAQMAGLLTALKILVDTSLFFLSYYIQRRWVFEK